MILVDSSVWIDYFRGRDTRCKEMVIKAAENFRKLRKRGTTIRKTADVIIASFCIEHGLPLLFSDKDFEPFVTELGLIKAR